MLLNVKLWTIKVLI